MRVVSPMRDALSSRSVDALHKVLPFRAGAIEVNDSDGGELWITRMDAPGIEILRLSGLSSRARVELDETRALCGSFPRARVVFSIDEGVVDSSTLACIRPTSVTPDRVRPDASVRRHSRALPHPAVLPFGTLRAPAGSPSHTPGKVADRAIR